MAEDLIQSYSLNCSTSWELANILLSTSSYSEDILCGRNKIEIEHIYDGEDDSVQYVLNLSFDENFEDEKCVDILHDCTSDVESKPSLQMETFDEVEDPSQIECPSYPLEEGDDKSLVHNTVVSCNVQVVCENDSMNHKFDDCWVDIQTLKMTELQKYGINQISCSTADISYGDVIDMSCSQNLDVDYDNPYINETNELTAQPMNSQVMKGKEKITDCQVNIEKLPLNVLVKYGQQSRKDEYIFNQSFQMMFNKKSTCITCQKCFGTSGDLRKHMRVHTGVKPYQCKVCHKCFKQSSHLSVHSRIHKTVKEFSCEFCSKRWRTESNLRKHLRIHSGDKPFGCDVCGQTFVSSSDMQRHVRTHTDKKLYKCLVCEQTFTRSHNFKVHLRNQHTQIIC